MSIKGLRSRILVYLDWPWYSTWAILKWRYCVQTIGSNTYYHNVTGDISIQVDCKTLCHRLATLRGTEPVSALTPASLILLRSGGRRAPESEMLALHTSSSSSAAKGGTTSMMSRWSCKYILPWILRSGLVYDIPVLASKTSRRWNDCWFICFLISKRQIQLLLTV